MLIFRKENSHSLSEIISLFLVLVINTFTGVEDES